MREHELHRHSAFHTARSITVVININQHVEVNLAVVHTLHSAYAGVFHRVVFTGQSRPKGLNSAVLWTPCEHPWIYFSLCLSYAMAEHPETSDGGFLFIGDDTIFDPCRLSQLDGRKFWTPRLWPIPYQPGVREDYWGAPLSSTSVISDQMEQICTWVSKPSVAYLGILAMLAVWWDWDANPEQRTISLSLDLAFSEMPDFYKEMISERLGPDWIDADGKMKQMVHHTEVDFFYLPATAAADWLHLGNHFHRYGVMDELTVPHLLYFLAGPHGLEVPRHYNVVGMKSEVKLPRDLVLGSGGLSDEDAKLLLRHGDGIYLPESWLPEPDTGNWTGTPLTWMHAYKSGNTTRREAFMQWWCSLPCLKGMHP